MNKLAIDNPLFERLVSNPPVWWRTLMEDPGISIQIRKDNSIDAYYNGGAIVTGLKFDGKKFKGSIHVKYVPLENSSGEYVPYVFGENTISFAGVKAMKLDGFCKETMKAIKANISKYYPADSEKGIQYNFVRKDPCFVDSEFEYSYNEDGVRKTVRIDLIRIDTAMRKIVFVEVKTVGDRRLYNNEIITQLKDYRNFVVRYREDLGSYYKKLLMIKMNLGILPECLKKQAFDSYEILERPLLLFGDCEQSWIDQNARLLDEKIKKYAIGCYYFGDSIYSCDIVSKSKKNRHIFDCLCD